MAITDDLLDRVRQIESGGDPNAVSRAGAIGPYQFMPATARQYGITDPRDERQAREGARRYLTDLYNEFGSVDRALMAYNWGPENVRRYMRTGLGAKGQPIPLETQQYVPKVMGAKVATGRDLSGELFGEKKPAAGRDLSDELFPDRPRQSKPGAMLPASEVPADKPPERSFGEKAARAVGLSVRPMFEAALSIPAIVGNAGTAAWNLATGDNKPMSSTIYRGWADAVFPTPETPVEKFSNAVATAGYGTAIPAAVAGAPIQTGVQATAPIRQLPFTTPTTQAGRAVAQQFSNNVGAQVAGAATGAGTTELLTQGGVDPVLSTAIGLGSGMVGGRLYQAGEDAAVRFASNRALATGRGVPNGAAMPEPARVQARMESIAADAGVDLTTLPTTVRREFEQAVQTAIRSNRPLNDEQASRWLTLQAAGVRNPSRAMVTRNPQDWAEEDRLMRLSGIGDPLRQRYEAASDAVKQAIRPDATPGDATTGQVVRGALREVASDLNSQRNKAYNAAWQAPEAKEGVPIAPLRQYLESKRAFFKTSPEYEAALEELKRLAGDRPSLTQENYEQLRKSVNAMFKLDNAGTLREIKNAMDDALTNAGKTSPFREAREQNQIYRSTVTDQGIVERLLARRTATDPKVWDNEVYGVVMSAAPNQIKQLRNTLAVGGKENAWTTLQNRVKEDLTVTLNQSPTTENRAASFVRFFDNNKERLAAIFPREQYTALENARKAAELVMQKVGGAPTNPSGTAGNLVEYLRKAGVTLGPIARALNIGTGGLLGAAADAGRQSIQNRAELARVSSALRPGLLGEAAAVPSAPILTPGLLGVLYGAQPELVEARR